MTPEQEKQFVEAELAAAREHAQELLAAQQRTALVNEGKYEEAYGVKPEDDVNISGTEISG